MLRRAIQENIVSFPSQVPVLSRRSGPDVQGRAVTLYFVRGWTMSRIGARYGLPDFRVSQILNEWAARAFALGFIQIVDAERFEALAERPSRGILEMPLSQTPVTAIPEISAAPAAARSTAARHALLDAVDTVIDSCSGRDGEFWLHSTAMFRSFSAAVQAIERDLKSSFPDVAAPPALDPNRFRGVA